MSRRARGPAGSIGASSGLASKPIKPKRARRWAVAGPRRRGDEGEGIAMGAGRDTTAGGRRAAAQPEQVLPILSCGRCGRPRRPTNSSDLDHRSRLLSWLGTTDQLTVDRSGRWTSGWNRFPSDRAARIETSRHSSRCRLPSLPQLCNPKQPPNRQQHTGYRTLPLSGRQEAIAIEADLTAACPLKGLVRRCRIPTGSVCGPTPHLQSSGHLCLTSHTGA